jgi:hypothetical protein
LGVVSGYQSFAAVGNANTTYYVIANQSASEWEVGIGTYTASGTLLSRTTVLSSSNSGSLVNFSAGTKDVFVDYPASKAVYEDSSGNIDSYPITGGTIDNTVIGATTPAAGTFTTVGVTTSINASSGSANADLNVNAKGTGSVFIGYQTTGASGLVLSRDPGTSNLSGRIFLDSSGGVSSIRNSGGNTINFATAATVGSSSGTEQARIAHTASAVNYVQVTGGATTKAVVQSSQGSDSNISFVTQTKGTGAIDLAAGSSGVNISNGGTVTAITRTSAGSGYTTIPSVAVSAPTTAGGVQAVVTVAQMQIAGATIQSGGTGYTVGDTLTIVGGTPVTSAATLTVTTVSAGVITGVNVGTFTNYTVLPTNPVSVTGGTGSGATFNITYAVISFTITNAGSGYVEQPTVTFSGGGGSGAAAYATVGSGTTVKTIGSTLSFSTPSSEVLRILDNSPSAQNYLQLESSGSGSIFRTAGASANPTFGFVNKGTGNFYFSTSNSVGNLQFNVAHTASAVNYVQVTGSATGGRPNISAQGSDTNLGIGLTTKGTGRHVFFNNNSTTSIQFSVGLAGTGTAVNYLNANGTVATTSPELTAEGTDTNLDIRFTPKGTGNVRFGTYTASILTPTGYVEIKDSGGTVRRLLVG